MGAGHRGRTASPGGDVVGRRGRAAPDRESAAMDQPSPPAIRALFFGLLGAIGVYGRNVVLKLLIVIPILACVAALPRALFWLYGWAHFVLPSTLSRAGRVACCSQASVLGRLAAAVAPARRQGRPCWPCLSGRTDRSRVFPAGDTRRPGDLAGLVARLLALARIRSPGRRPDGNRGRSRRRSGVIRAGDLRISPPAQRPERRDPRPSHGHGSARRNDRHRLHCRPAGGDHPIPLPRSPRRQSPLRLVRHSHPAAPRLHRDQRLYRGLELGPSGARPRVVEPAERLAAGRCRDLGGSFALRHLRTGRPLREHLTQRSAGSRLDDRRDSARHPHRRR